MGIKLSLKDILTAPSIGALFQGLELPSHGLQSNGVGASEPPQNSIESGLSLRLPVQTSTSISQSTSTGLDLVKSENRVGSKTGMGKRECYEPSSSRTLIAGDMSELLPDRGYPATEMQLSLIRGTLGNPRMNVIYHRHTCKAKDLAMLKRAWETVIKQQDMFHAEFHMHNGAGFWTRTSRQFSWSEVIVQSEWEMEQELLKPPSWSGVGYAFKAIIQQDGCCTLLFQVHHALIDGYSMERLLGQVKQVASSGTSPKTLNNPSMLDFLCQRDAYIRQHQHEAAEFWADQRDTLSKAASGLGMVFPRRDHHRQKGEKTPESLGNIAIESTPDASFLTNALSFDLGPSLYDRIARFAREYDVTEASMYHGAWALVMSLLTDSDCVAFGTVMSGRTLPIAGALEVVGNLATALHLGVEVDQDQTTVEFLKDMVTRMTHLASFEWALPDGCYDRQFSSLLAIQFEQSMSGVDITADSVGLSGDGGPITSWRSRMNTEIPISVIIEAKGTVTIQYSSTQFHQRDMEQVATLFQRMLRALLHPSYTVGMCLLEGITLEEQSSLREQGNCHSALTTKASVHDSLVSLFRRTADQYPDAIAAQKLGGEQPKIMTYRELDQDSDRICQRLSQIIQPGDVVCVHADQSLAWLKACYGSTGQPKGVLCTHQGVVAFQRDLEVRLYARLGWKVAQTMSVSFDGNIHEIFSTLSYGASLILPATACDPFAPLTVADAAIFTPSAAQALDPADYPNLKALYLVGEQVPQEVCDRWAAPRRDGNQIRLYNMYGPTEATCGATIKRLQPWERITIGKPNSSTRIYILDRHHRLTFPGWIGQVYLAGVQVSKGYIGSQTANQERFLPDTICHGLGEKMYSTGDLGYWTDSGEVVLVGRTDRQVKLRGFRIDLDALEARIGKLPQVSAVAVACKDDYLVAMVQPQTLSIGGLKISMAAALPVHMVPRVIIAVDAFPLTKAGKLDYSKVRDGNSCLTDENNKIELSSSMTDMEHRVARVWQQTLKLDDVVMLNLSANSIFSSLGGHSLHQLRLASRLSHCFSCHIPLKLVIQNQQLNEQASMISNLIRENLEKNEEQVMGAEPCPTKALSPIEQWWADQYYDEATSYMFTEINKTFDLAHDELIRVHITESHMLVVVSHILCDLTTMQLLLDDVANIYHGRSLIPQQSPPYPVQRLEQRRYSISADEKSFWMNYLRDSPESLGRGPLTGATRLPHHQNQIKTHTGAGTSMVMKLPRATVESISAYVSSRSKEGITRHQVAVAAVALALSPSGEDSIDVTIGGPYMNRGCESDLNTVGLFLEPVPIRVRFPHFQHQKGLSHKDASDDTGMEARLSSSPSSCDSNAYVTAVQAASQAALSHSISWDELHKLWHGEISTSTRNMFDVMVTFHEEDNTLTLPISGTEPLYTWAEGSKFPLMCEFLAVQNGTGTSVVVLRLEYDDQILSQGQVVQIGNQIIHFELEKMEKGLAEPVLLHYYPSQHNGSSNTDDQNGGGGDNGLSCAAAASDIGPDCFFPTWQ
ncbi:hypothetical protein DV738_g1678, partial [Chaetothyriales sp. CBS 135597]